MADTPPSPIAWMHNDPKRRDIIHEDVKQLWLKVRPQQVEHYTIPLYLHP